MNTAWFKTDSERIATLFCDSNDPKMFLANEIERALWHLHDWHEAENKKTAKALETATSFIKEVAQFQESQYFSALAQDTLLKMGYDKK